MINFIQYSRTKFNSILIEKKKSQILIRLFH